MSYKVKILFPDNLQRLNNTAPDAKLSKEPDGYYWYFNVYSRFNSNEPYKTLVFKWKPGMVAKRVPNMVGETTDRGSIAVNHLGGAAEFSWEGTDLYVQDIPEFNAATSAVIDILINELTTLKQKVIELESRTGILSEDDIKALQWVKNNTKALG